MSHRLLPVTSRTVRPRRSAPLLFTAPPQSLKDGRAQGPQQVLPARLRCDQDPAQAHRERASSGAARCRVARPPSRNDRGSAEGPLRACLGRSRPVFPLQRRHSHAGSNVPFPSRSLRTDASAESAHDASHERPVQHLRRVHLQSALEAWMRTRACRWPAFLIPCRPPALPVSGDQVQLEEGGRPG